MKQPDFSGRGEYEIKVRGHIDEQWSYWFEGMTITTGFSEDGIPITTFSGSIIDQAALHSVLDRIRDIHMPLISVNQIRSQGTSDPF